MSWKMRNWKCGPYSERQHFRFQICGSCGPVMSSLLISPERSPLWLRVCRCFAANMVFRAVNMLSKSRNAYSVHSYPAWTTGLMVTMPSKPPGPPLTMPRSQSEHIYQVSGSRRLLHDASHRQESTTGTGLSERAGGRRRQDGVADVANR